VRIEYVLDAWPTPRRATGEVLVSRRRPGRRRRPSGAPDYISEGDMKHVLAIVLVLHGLIHTLGFVKAFRLADVAQLREPIGPAAGLLWLTAAALLVASAALLLAGARLVDARSGGRRPLAGAHRERLERREVRHAR
jgi:hypothetical protein